MSSAILVVKTKSGSTYHVDPVKKTVLRVEGGAHYAGRAVDGAMQYTNIHMEVGEPMGIYWGEGRDQYSPDDGLDDKDRQRHTYTSSVLSIEPLVDCMA